MFAKTNQDLKRTTKFAVGTLVIIGVIGISLFFLNNYLENKIRTGIENSLERSYATYDKVDVKLLDRSAAVINPSININNKLLKVDKIQLNDIQLWDYITNKDIIIGELKIANPELRIFNSKAKEKKSGNNKKSSEFKHKVVVKNVNVSGGSLHIFENDSVKPQLYTKIRDVKLEEVKINSKTLKETIPFNYDLILLNADSVFYDLDKQHTLAAGKFVIDNHKVTIQDLGIIPKFSKAGHQKTISVEKDRYDLKIDSIAMSNFNWSMHNDTLKIQNPVTLISGVQFLIYRDKLQPDDTSIKPLYGEMIRKMPVLLQLDSVYIRQAYIKYEEKIHEDREPGVVDFSNLNASLTNITNIDLNRNSFPKTVLNAEADFMNESPLSVTLNFDISDISNQFHIKGDMGRLAAEQMNEFMKPAMNVQASGEILSMYFNFYGNDTRASGDMRLAYKDFKIEVFKKDGREKNNFVSTLANLIVKNKAINEKANYKEVSFTRDKTKSFWNYLWNLIKNGALKSFL